MLFPNHQCSCLKSPITVSENLLCWMNTSIVSLQHLWPVLFSNNTLQIEDQPCVIQSQVTPTTRPVPVTAQQYPLPSTSTSTHYPLLVTDNFLNFLISCAQHQLEVARSKSAQRASCSFFAPIFRSCHRCASWRLNNWIWQLSSDSQSCCSLYVLL